MNKKNLAKLEKKISALLSVLSERYGFSESISLQECYEQLPVIPTTGRTGEESPVRKRTAVLWEVA